MRLLEAARVARRKRAWMLRPATAPKIANAARAALAFVAGAEHVKAPPLLVKVDLSPVCNLRCTVCVHAGAGAGDERIAAQTFRKGQSMPLEQYGRLIDELRGQAIAVSLYTWGDPLLYRDLDAACAMTTAAGLGSHISSNLSMPLSDARLASLVESGLGHITVCVDGLTQATYAKTRVGGEIEVVLDNLRRLVAARDRARGPRLFVEMQFIRFRHNAHEEERARALAAELRVDAFASFWGSLHNMGDLMPDRYRTAAPLGRAAAPRCTWPFFATVVKYNGDVVPCCDFRAAAQYIGPESRGDAEARVLGNVFETSLTDVWNSEAYRAIRRLVTNPARTPEAERASSFCDGCPRCFRTDVAETRWLGAEDHDFDAIYTEERRGRPVRRR